MESEVELISLIQNLRKFEAELWTLFDRPVTLEASIKGLQYEIVTGVKLLNILEKEEVEFKKLERLDESSNLAKYILMISKLFGEAHIHITKQIQLLKELFDKNANIQIDEDEFKERMKFILDLNKESNVSYTSQILKKLEDLSKEVRNFLIKGEKQEPGFMKRVLGPTISLILVGIFALGAFAPGIAAAQENEDFSGTHLSSQASDSNLISINDLRQFPFIIVDAQGTMYGKSSTEIYAFKTEIQANKFLKDLDGSSDYHIVKNPIYAGSAINSSTPQKFMNSDFNRAPEIQKVLSNLNSLDDIKTFLLGLGIPLVQINKFFDGRNNDEYSIHDTLNNIVNQNNLDDDYYNYFKSWFDTNFG